MQVAPASGNGMAGLPQGLHHARDSSIGFQQSHLTFPAHGGGGGGPGGGSGNGSGKSPYLHSNVSLSWIVPEVCPHFSSFWIPLSMIQTDIFLLVVG